MTNRPTILIIDDQPGRRDFCRTALERERYEIKQMATVADAIAAVEKNPDSLIIIGDGMRDRDGVSFIRKLKSCAFATDASVIAVGSPGHGEPLTRALQDGADEFIAESVSAKEFALRVGAFVRISQRQAALRQSSERLGERARVMDLLLEFSQQLIGADSDDLDGVLESTVNMAAQITCCSRVSIMLPDAQTGDLSLAKTTAVKTAAGAAAGLLEARKVAVRVLRSGEPVVRNVLEAATSDGAADELCASVPLIANALTTHERVVGVMNLSDGHGRRPFSDMDLALVELLGNMSASAIDAVGARAERDRAEHAIVVALAKLAEYRDNDTGKHLERVSCFARVLAEELRARGTHPGVLDDQFLSDLQRSVPLHDIGKVAIPDQILLKSGKLSPQERIVMETHAAIGADTIRSVLDFSPVASFLKMAEEIARAHHEWYDGTGYPRGLKGTGIPLSARIVAVADVYDAVRTKRPYKDPMPHAQAVAIIRHASDTQFDPVIEAAFRRREREFADVATELADEGPNPPDPCRVDEIQAHSAVIT